MEWEHTIRAEKNLAFTFHHTTRPLVRSAILTTESYREIDGYYQTIHAGTFSRHGEDFTRAGTEKSNLPAERHPLQKEAMLSSISHTSASRYLNRFHEVIRRSSQGNLRLNEWTIHENIRHDTTTNSAGLLIQILKRLRTIALQISSPTGLVIQTLPVVPEREGEVVHILEELCGELTSVPEPPPPTGRCPALFSSDTTAAVIQAILPLIRNRTHTPFTLPDGWQLCDDPSHPDSFQRVRFDAEGRETSETSILKGDRSTAITDTLTARRKSLPCTGHACRPSILNVPFPDYHNLYLEGPEGTIEDVYSRWNRGIHLLRPLQVNFTEKNTRIQIVASGYSMEESRITGYHPVITCRFTLKDLMRNLDFTVGKMRFHLKECPIGTRALFIRNINIFS